MLHRTVHPSVLDFNDTTMLPYGSVVCLWIQFDEPYGVTMVVVAVVVDVCEPLVLVAVDTMVVVSGFVPVVPVSSVVWPVELVPMLYPVPVLL